MSASAQVRAAFDFDVTKLPLTGPNGLETPFHGLFRTDTKEAVGYAVKSGYVPHSVDDVCALVEAAEVVIGECTVQCYWSGNAHDVLIEPTAETRAEIFGTEDSIFPRLRVTAGYDGTAFRASLGWWRDICANLYVPKRLGGVSASIWHTARLRPRINELVDTFGRVAERWDDVVTVAKDMDGREVKLHEFIAKVYGDSDNAFAARRTEAIVMRVIRERAVAGRPSLEADGVVTMWEAFNSIQGYAQHDRARNSHTSDLGRALVALGDADVDKAWVLAT